MGSGNYLLDYLDREQDREAMIRRQRIEEDFWEDYEDDD